MAPKLSQTRQRATSKVFLERLPQLQQIRNIVRQDILPQVLAEFREETPGEVIDEETLEWLDDWIDDMGQLFRLFKKRDFNTQDTLSAIRRTLVWRLHVLPSVPPPSPSPILYFLAHPLISSNSTNEISTPPILYFSLGELTKFVKSPLPPATKIAELKTLLINTYEVARRYMRDLDTNLMRGSTSSREGNPSHPEDSRVRILQFVLMVDVEGAGMITSVGKEIASWLAQDLAPNYPGLCNAVYVVNYSWSYNALWGFIKRFLPAKVLERISFPSTDEMMLHFYPECLPEGQGGFLSTDRDHISPRYRHGLSPAEPVSQDDTSYSERGSSSSSSSTAVASGADDDNSKLAESVPKAYSPLGSILLDPFSPANPYYGYPAILYHSPVNGSGKLPLVPVPLHPHRRYRDLLRTLFSILVSKWQGRIIMWIRLLQIRFTTTRATLRLLHTRLWLYHWRLRWFGAMAALMFLLRWIRFGNGRIHSTPLSGPLALTAGMAFSDIIPTALGLTS